MSAICPNAPWPPTCIPRSDTPATNATSAPFDNAGISFHRGLPEKRDEGFARRHLEKIGFRLTTLTRDQPAYLGVEVAGF